MARDAGSRAPGPDLSSLPSVEELASSLDGVPHALAVRAAREAIAAARAGLMEGDQIGDIRADALARAARGERPHLRSVINATGVIVHTNLGRAPLAEAAVEAVRAWLWFVDGAILDWLDHRDLDRGELGALLLGSLAGALSAAGAEVPPPPSAR